ncbi:Tight junction protein ZO-3 [Merluccius polli]|uniref:Tight junction protein ZO-3 n=1 Tax=Merluccius polli TaxID=89951 RepID=A0AA47NCC9_MERPO|nr:Tight junction protein ZO-3 [Merluccius polli]
MSALPNPRSSPMAQNWGSPRTLLCCLQAPQAGCLSRTRTAASRLPRCGKRAPRPNSRYKVLPDLPLPGMKASPITVRQEPHRRVSSPVRVPPPDSESESDESTNYPPRQGTVYSQDSRDKYRVPPEVAPKPQVEPPHWTPPTATPTQRAVSESESEASYASVPRRESSDSGEFNKTKDRYRVLPEIQSVPAETYALSRPSSQQTGSGRFLRIRPTLPSQEIWELGARQQPRVKTSATRVRPSKTTTVRSGISVKNNPTCINSFILLSAKPEEEPLYSLPPDSYPATNLGYSSDLHTVSFTKDGSIGLRLVGGNDVGIFVGGVQPNSPAHEQGMREGDQIMQVNKVDFNQFTREEAANFLLQIKHGEPVEICTQNKMDLYKKILKSSLGDNFYMRTHFDHEAESTIGLGFTRGEVFRVVDTMHRGKLGNWLAIRMGNDLHELDKGTIPNQARAETLAIMEQAQRNSGDRQASGPRAEFWKLRGLRGAKKNARRTRDDLLQLTIQGKFPAYEKVLLREANFKRPIVILGPLNDIAMEKLAKEMPDDYEVAEMVPRSSGGDSASTVIKLDTVRAIAEKDKHPLLDITPTAVERLNYIQYHPMVLFLDPHSRKDIKAMRQRYSPNSNKSSRRLYTQALKMRKHCSHLFSARVDLQPSSNVWYEILKDKIRHQQAKPVWVSEVTLESGGEQDLDTLEQSHSDYLSAASDLDDTDGEPFTDGEAYTDEDLDEAFPGQDTAKIQRNRTAGSALARSSEPAVEFHSDLEPMADSETYSLQEVPPLMHVPEPKGTRGENYSPPHGAAASHRSFSDSDFSATEPAVPGSPSEGPPDFVAPDPTRRIFEPLDDKVMAPERGTPPVCHAVGHRGEAAAGVYLI